MKLGPVTAGTARVATVVAARIGLDSVLGVVPHVDGLDRLPDGPMVVACNRLSPVDPFLLAWLLAAAGHRDPVVLLRGDAPRIPLVSRLLDAGVLHVEDDTPDDPADGTETSRAYAQACDQLAAGRTVLLAPERRVSPSLELMPLRSGAASLATATGASLVPAGLFGTHRLYDGDRFRFRRRVPVTVAFGHPVLTGGSARQVTKMLHLDMEALYERALDDYPDREEGEAAAEWWPSRRGGRAPSLGAVIDARAVGNEVWSDDDADDSADVEIWAEPETVAPTAPAPPAAPPARSRQLPVQAMAHDVLHDRYPRSYHRNAAQQGGHLRDLKGVVAFDLPGQPHQHHPVVHLDHHVDGHLTVYTDDDQLDLADVDLSTSPVRVVAYGRLEVGHVLDSAAGPVAVPAGTLATFLGVLQDHSDPQPIKDWDHVKSLHTRA